MPVGCGTVPEGRRHSLVVYVVKGYRRPTRSTTGYRVDLGGILPEASGEVSPAEAAQLIVRTLRSSP